jgi:hypothetical protein
MKNQKEKEEEGSIVENREKKERRMKTWKT